MKRILGALLIVGLLFGAFDAHSQTLKFTVQQTVETNGSVTPTLTWCTEATASSGLTCSGTPASACTASGDWTGTKAGAGTQALPSVTTSKNYVLQCSWPGQDSLTVKWTPPTTNDDGTPLTDLKGFKLYYGTSPTMSSNTVKDIPVGVTSYTVSGLAPATYYMVMSAYNTAGAESIKSAPIVSKVVSAGSSVSQSVAVKFPSPPLNVE